MTLESKSALEAAIFEHANLPGEIFLGEFLTIVVGDLLGLLTNPFSQEKNTIETLMMGMWWIYRGLGC